MTRAEQHFDLMRRLCAIADNVSQNRMTTLSRLAIDVLRAEVANCRMQPLDDSETRLIDYEAVCLVEAMTALTYARADKNLNAEERAVMYINTLRVFMRNDLNMAQRKADFGSVQ